MKKRPSPLLLHVGPNDSSVFGTDRPLRLRGSPVAPLPYSPDGLIEPETIDIMMSGRLAKARADFHFKAVHRQSARPVGLVLETRPVIAPRLRGSTSYILLCVASIGSWFSIAYCANLALEKETA